MRKLLLIIVCFYSVLVSAQENSLTNKLYLNVTTDVTTESKGLTSYGADFQLGYKFIPSLYAFATFNGSLSLYDKDGVKDHIKTTNLGGGLGYRLSPNDNTSCCFDIKTSASVSVGNVDWKNTTYEAGVFCRFTSKGLAPQLGLGYRYQDSHTAVVSSRGCIFASLGFSL
jgi:hypothetical protein